MVAKTNATLKLDMLQELASKRLYERAQVVQEKATLKGTTSREKLLVGK